MSSVTFVHSEETLTVPVFQAITNCSLFRKNVTLASTPYKVEFPVSLSIFREFVSALEGNVVEITDTNLTGLQRLCEEFGFSEFAAKLSKFSPPSEDSQGRQLGSPLVGVRSAHLSEYAQVPSPRRSTVIEQQQPSRREGSSFHQNHLLRRLPNLKVLADGLLPLNHRAQNFGQPRTVRCVTSPQKAASDFHPNQKSKHYRLSALKK
jgi:hypothetical protein